MEQQLKRSMSFHTNDSDMTSYGFCDPWIRAWLSKANQALGQEGQHVKSTDQAVPDECPRISSVPETVTTLDLRWSGGRPKGDDKATRMNFKVSQSNYVDLDGHEASWKKAA